MNPLIKRLTESTVNAGATEALPVIIDARPVSFWRCPHCQQEIHEKHVYEKEGVDYHADCQRAIKLPPPDWSQYDPKWRELLDPDFKKS